MIIKAGESVLDTQVPAAAVAQVIVVHERQQKMMVPGLYGPTVHVVAGSTTGVIKRGTAIMRVRERDMPAPAEPSMPVCWCPRADGRIEVRPPPDRDYDLELMGRNGKPIGSGRKAVEVFPVESHVAALTAAAVDQQRRVGEPPRVERFVLRGDDE